MFRAINILSLMLVSHFALATPLVVPYTERAPSIDGLDNDPQWQAAAWRPMDQLMVGSMPDATDFSGEYRLLWNEKALYLQAKIQDDVLFDSHANPLTQYWDDDALEIFIDEDASGGDHQYNYNAFAYHVALDNQAIDIGPDQKPHAYNSHIQSRWQRQNDGEYYLIWEVAITLYGDDYQDGADNQPVSLTPGKIIGFMLAYCDNDGSAEREHFVGSQAITPVNGDKNRGWIDASVFGKIQLKKP